MTSRPLILRIARSLALVSAIAWKTAGADEITVYGRKREPGATTVTARETRELPGAFGDPGRVIEALPGVIPLGTALPFYFVRGATPSNTSYFLDGMRLPLFSHAPPGGGVVSGSAIESVDFFPGAAPVRFGAATGGVLSVTTRPPSERTRGEADVRLYDSSALVEAPLADGRASVLASGRYGYSQVLLDAIGSSAHQTYWDYYARGTFRASRTEDLSLVLVGARDVAGRGDWGVDTTFHRAELRFDTHTSGGGSARVALTTGVNVQGNDVGSVTDRIAGIRVDASQPINDSVRIGLGASVTYERYAIDLRALGPAPDPEILFAPREDLSNAAYANLVWRVSPAVELDAGVRAQLFTTKRNTYPRVYGHPVGVTPPLTPPTGGAARIAADPRLTARARLDRRVTFVSALGLAHGPPSFLLPGLAMSRLEDGLQTAVQASSGFELALPFDATLKITGFLHNYLDLSDPSTTCPDIHALLFNPTHACYGRRVRGRSFGGEVLVRRALTKPLAGFLSYTLSRSTRQSHAPGWTLLGASNEAMVEVPSEWDRTHVLSATGSCDLGGGFRVAARVSYATGRPYSHTVRGVLVPPYNRDRLPDVHRIDLRFEKKWMLGQERTLSLVLEWFNATAQREVTACRPATTIQTSAVPATFVTGGVVDDCTLHRTALYTVPSVGLEGTF